MSKKATMKKASKKQTDKAGTAAEPKVKASKSAQPKPSRDSKKANVLEMLARPDGATNQEIQKATEWQPHTVRGFLSLAKKKGLNLEVIKREDGEKAYYAATT